MTLTVEQRIQRALSDLRDGLCCHEAYYCPTSRKIECRERVGFDVCCADINAHVSIDGIQLVGPKRGDRVTWNIHSLKGEFKGIGEGVYNGIDWEDGLAEVLRPGQFCLGTGYEKLRKAPPYVFPVKKWWMAYYLWVVIDAFLNFPKGGIIKLESCLRSWINQEQAKYTLYKDAK